MTLRNDRYVLHRYRALAYPTEARSWYWGRAMTPTPAPQVNSYATQPIHRFLASDHRRLESLLEQAGASDPIDLVPFAAFRAGLLKHIGMEEKVLLPAAQQARGGAPLPIAERLRLQHGAIAALLVPTPTRAVLTALRSVLHAHNEIEEGAGGLYQICDELEGLDAEAVVARLRAYPEVPVHAHVDGPRIMAATERALLRAGFEDEAASLAAGSRD